MYLQINDKTLEECAVVAVVLYPCLELVLYITYICIFINASCKVEFKRLMHYTGKLGLNLSFVLTFKKSKLSVKCG